MIPPGRVLGLDLGDVRIGVAISDEARRVAVAVGTVHVGRPPGELKAIGVQPPSSVPLYYRVSADLLTQADKIQVVGADTSGAVEPVLVGAADRLWVTLGSDHTDRKAESFGVAIAKQICAKAVGRKHPGMVLLFPNKKPADAPAVEAKPKDHWVLSYRVPATAGGEKGFLGFSLVVVGATMAE